MFRKTAEFIIRFRIPILIVIMAVTLYFLFQFRGVKVLTDLDDFVPQGHPYAKVQKQMEQVFYGGDMVQLVVENKKGDIFNINFLSKMLDLTQDVYLLPGILPPRIASLSDFKTKIAKGYPGGFDVQRLIVGGKPETEEQAKKIKEGVLGDKLIHGRLVSSDLKATNIMAEFRGVDYTELFRKYQALQKKYSDENTNIYLSGRPILLGWIDLFQRKLTRVFGIAVVIMAGMLWLAFRNKRGVIFPLCAAMVSVIWGFGLLGLFGYNLDPLASIMPFLILGIGVSHSVQIMKRYCEEISLNPDAKEACTKVITILAAPCLTSIITDAAAFATLIIVKINMLKTLAIIGTLSLGSITFNVLVLIPICLSFLKPPKKIMFAAGEEARPTIMNRILTRVAILSTQKKGAWGLIGGFSILIIAGIIGTFQMQVGGRAPGAGAFYEDASYSTDTKAIGEKFPGAITYYLVFEGKERDAIKDVRILKNIETLQTHLKKNPQVGGSLSLSDFIKRMNVTMNEGDQSFYEIPYVGEPPHGIPNSKLARCRIAEYLNLYTSGVPEEFNFIVDYEYRFTNLQAFLKDMDADTLASVIKDTKDFIENNWKRGSCSLLFGKGDGTFEKRVNYDVKGDWPRSLTCSDFNGDKRQDLAVVNEWSNNVSLLFGKGDGTFQPAINYPVGEAPDFLCSSDFNEDGKQDLAVSNSGGRDISVLLGKGDGTFEPAKNYPTGKKSRFLVSSDLNGDGKLDIVVANEGSDTLSILLNNGDGTFKKAKEYPTEAEPQFVTAADFNGDGKMDLAVSHGVGYSVALYQGQGDGTFTGADDYWLACNQSFLTSSDLNGDGKADLILSKYGENSVTILLGKREGVSQKPGAPIKKEEKKREVASGEVIGAELDWMKVTEIHPFFEKAVDYKVGMEPHFLVTGDFNKDGWQDLAAVNNFSNNVSVLLGKGNGTFQSVVNYEVGECPNFLGASDFNGDGKVDLAVVNEEYGAVKPHVAGGLGGVVAAINEELRSGLVSNMIQISLIVFICCALMLRSWVGAIIIMISLFTRVIATYGVMGFTSIPLSLYTTPIASMGIGIGVDYVIYVIARIQEELALTKGGNMQEATIKALNTTGRAVFYTVSAVVIGCLIFILSPLKFQMELGAMIAVIIGLNGLGAICLVSPVLYLMKPKFIYNYIP